MAENRPYWTKLDYYEERELKQHVKGLSISANKYM